MSRRAVRSVTVLPSARRRRLGLAVAGLLAAAIAARAGAPATALFAELVPSGVEFVWRSGRAGEFHLPEITCGGVALLDYDNDGDLDVYLAQGGPLPPAAAADGRLFRNDLELLPGGGRRLRFTDVTAASGVRTPGYGCGVAAGDVDNDGWTDLYLTHFGPDYLLRNNGDGTFRDVTAAAGASDARWSVPASFVDFDRDGWLDLYVGNYLEVSLQRPKICRGPTGARDYCNPDAYVGVPDRLLRNRGDGTFADVSAAAGVAAVASKSLGVVAADFSGDGRPDLFVANDGVPNQLWIQQPDGRVVDEALERGCALDAQGRPRAGMGADAADYDNDGDEDLVVTHLTGEANGLFRNDGAGGFADVAASAGLAGASWPFTSWGVAWVDVDNDGWLDLPVVSGAVRMLPALAAAGDPFPFHQRKQLFRNLGGAAPRFAEVTSEAGPAFARSEVSRGLAAGDLDNDGDPDLVVVNAEGPARILLAQTGQDRPWLGLRLVGRGGRDLLGAVAELRRDGMPTLRRRVHTDGGYAAAHDPRLLFGLAGGAAIESVRVRWPGGEVEEWRDVPPGRYTTLRQGSGSPVG